MCSNISENYPAIESGETWKALAFSGSLFFSKSLFRPQYSRSQRLRFTAADSLRLKLCTPEVIRVIRVCCRKIGWTLSEIRARRFLRCRVRIGPTPSRRDLWSVIAHPSPEEAARRAAGFARWNFSAFPRNVRSVDLASRLQSDEEILHESRFIAPLSYDVSLTFVSGKEFYFAEKSYYYVIYYHFQHFPFFCFYSLLCISLQYIIALYIMRLKPFCNSNYVI